MSATSNLTPNCEQYLRLGTISSHLDDIANEAENLSCAVGEMGSVPADLPDELPLAELSSVVNMSMGASYQQLLEFGRIKRRLGALGEWVEIAGEHVASIIEANAPKTRLRDDGFWDRFWDEAGQELPDDACVPLAAIQPQAVVRHLEIVRGDRDG